MIVESFVRIICFVGLVASACIFVSTAALSQQRCYYERRSSSRRDFLSGFGSSVVVAPSAILTAVVTTTWPTGTFAAEDKPSYSDLLALVKQAQKQLGPIPKLIEQEKWDSVRAILIEPPLADCWAKTNRPLLSNFAEAIGDKGGDELAALEAKEEIVSHLRYLDMAVYNNNFNPITSQGKTGATAGLVRSYYEDPINEYKASAAAIDALVQLTADL